MIFDKELLFWDGAAGGATASSAVDLGRDKAGVGEKLDVHVNGTGLTAGTALVLTHCDTEGGSYTTLATFNVDYTVLNAGFNFSIPHTCKRYAKLTITAGAGGTVLAGIVKDSQNGF